MAEVLRGKGLADPRNVVVFTFHSEQSHAPYGRKVHRHGAMLHFAFRQSMFDKHGIDGLQKEFGGQIHDRPVFIVKFAAWFKTGLFWVTQTIGILLPGEGGLDAEMKKTGRVSNRFRVQLKKVETL